MYFGTAYQRKKPKLLPITPERALEMIKLTSETAEDWLLPALNSLGYMTGSRIGEAVEFTRNNILFIDSQRVRIRLPVEKKRQPNVMRTIPIPISLPYAKALENLAWEYFKPALEEQEYTARIFKRWRNMSEYIRRYSPTFEFMAELPDGREAIIERKIHSHFWRSVRASHLVDYYGFGDYQLQAYFGWTDTRPGTAYVRLRDVEKLFGFSLLSSEGQRL